VGGVGGEYLRVNVHPVLPLIATPFGDRATLETSGERFMKRLLLALAILLGVQTLAMAQSLVAPLLWKNQRNSTLEITWATPPIGGNLFGGTFINQAKGFDCKGLPYSAIGSSENMAVTFSVGFLKCDTYTTWTGSIRGRKMYTNWSLIYYVNGVGKTLNGTDVFTRIR
jgi:hypothetical protein